MADLHKLYRHGDQVITDAFDRIAVSLHLQSKKNNYRLFVLSGSEPGAGTTTMAIELAISTSLLKKKTILIDGDIHKKSKEKRLSQSIPVGLSDCLLKNIEYGKIINKTNFENLDYIASGAYVFNFAECYSSDRIDGLMAFLKEKYDYCFWDMPAISAAFDAQVVASKADGVILVATQNGSKEMLKSAKNALEKVDTNIVGVLGNMMDKSEYQSYIRDYNYFSKKKYKTLKNQPDLEETKYEA